MQTRKGSLGQRWPADISLEPESGALKPPPVEDDGNPHRNVSLYFHRHPVLTII